MPIETGQLLATATSDERMNEIKSLIALHLADHLTLVSDTGSGNSRVLKYSSPYSNHRFHIVYLSIYGTNVRTRNIADSGDLHTGSTSCTFSKILSYTIISNQDSFLLHIDHLIVVGAKAGMKSMLSVKSSSFYNYALVSDYALSNFITFYPQIQRILESGAELFYPAYASDDANAAFLDAPCADIFIIYNKQSIADLNLFTCAGKTYFVIAKAGANATFVMRVN